MPRLDDPTYKLRQTKKFVRKSLRPWDNLEDLHPIAVDESVTSNQIVINKETKDNQIVSESINNKEPVSKHMNNAKSQLVTNHVTNRNPISNQEVIANSNQLVNQSVSTKVYENTILDHIKRLSGQQLKLFLYIVENCTSRGLLYTTPVTNSNLTLLLNTDADTVKTTTQRLVNKKLVSREHGKQGRGGFCIFRITEEARNAALEVKRQLQISNQIVNQMVSNYNNQTVTNKETNGETRSSSSSSNIDILNTITTVPQLKTTLPPEWEEVDLSDLHQRGVRFGKEHMVNLWPYLKDYTAFDFQESIDGYVYDIDNKHVYARKGYLNLLIGTIRNGQLYISSHYTSPERAKINEIIELSKKRKAEEAAYLEALNEEKFKKWLEEYGDANIEKHLPSGLVVDFKHRGKDSLNWIKQHIYRKSL